MNETTLDEFRQQIRSIVDQYDADIRRRRRARLVLLFIGLAISIVIHAVVWLLFGWRLWLWFCAGALAQDASRVWVKTCYQVTDTMGDLEADL